MITESFPKTQVEFDKRFSTDEACHEYLSSIRWPDGFVCPHCEHPGGWRRNGREEWVCSAKSCGKETSLRSGTVLHNSPKALKTWIWAMFLMTTNKQSISALRLQQLMGFGCYRTALRWLRELRRAMSHVVENQTLGPIVEADEMYVGHRIGKSQRTETIVRIAGVVERLESGCGRARLKGLTGADEEAAIQSFVKQSVKIGSLICSDGLNAYEALAKDGYLHDGRAVTSKKGTLKMADGTPKVLVHLPKIHLVFSLAQRVLLGAHQGACSIRHLQGYMDEYCFRFNRRNDPRPLAVTQRLTDAITKVKAVPYWRTSGRTSPRNAMKQQTTLWTSYAQQFRAAANG